MAEDSLVPSSSFRIGVSSSSEQRSRTVSRTKDRGAEKFWAEFDDLVAVCKTKAEKKAWGARKILKELPNVTLSERRVRKALESYFFSLEDNCLFYRSSELNVSNRSV